MGWVVSTTPQPLYLREKPGTNVQAGWAPGPVWTCAKNFAPTGIRSPDRPARSQSLYRLSYPVHKYIYIYIYIERERERQTDRHRIDFFCCVANDNSRTSLLIFEVFLVLLWQSYLSLVQTKCQTVFKRAS
jgi:hypothetical protein